MTKGKDQDMNRNSWQLIYSKYQQLKSGGAAATAEAKAKRNARIQVDLFGKNLVEGEAALKLIKDNLAAATDVDKPAIQKLLTAKESFILNIKDLIAQACRVRDQPSALDFCKTMHQRFLDGLNEDRVKYEELQVQLAKQVSAMEVEIIKLVRITQNVNNQVNELCNYSESDCLLSECWNVCVDVTAGSGAAVRQTRWIT